MLRTNFSVVAGLFALLAGCASLQQAPSSPSSSSGPPSPTKLLFASIDTCVDQAKGNDMAFTEKCVPIVDGKEIEIEVEKVSARFSSVSIEGNVAGREQDVNCELAKVATEEEAESLKNSLMALKAGDKARLRLKKMTRYSNYTVHFEGCTLVLDTPDAVAAH